MSHAGHPSKGPVLLIIKLENATLRITWENVKDNVITNMIANSFFIFQAWIIRVKSTAIDTLLVKLLEPPCMLVQPTRETGTAKVL